MHILAKGLYLSGQMTELWSGTNLFLQFRFLRATNKRITLNNDDKESAPPCLMS